MLHWAGSAGMLMIIFLIFYFLIFKISVFSDVATARAQDDLGEADVRRGHRRKAVLQGARGGEGALTSRAHTPARAQAQGLGDRARVRR